jgi:hypothetical protein
MKHGVLCLLLLSACSLLGPESREPAIFEYALIWTCLSPEGCERTEDVARIDHVQFIDRDGRFTSTQDASFSASARIFFGNSLPDACAWLDLLSLFGHALERGPLCDVPGGFELELSIPNQDPATSSLWLVEGRDLDVW